MQYLGEELALSAPDSDSGAVWAASPRGAQQPWLALSWRGQWARAQRCRKQTLGPKGKLHVCVAPLGSCVAHPLRGVVGLRAMGAGGQQTGRY